MIRRCPAPLTALVAALVLGFGSQPISAMADGISSSNTAGTANYTLTTTTGLPAPTVPVPGTISCSSARSPVGRPRWGYRIRASWPSAIP